MNNIFEFDITDFIEFVSNSYKTDKNYNSDLYKEHIIKIIKRESTEGAEKTITFKIDKQKRKLRVKIPKGIKNIMVIKLPTDM